MRYLLDSHVLLWLMAESYKVGPKTKQLLSDESVNSMMSLASLWELGLKHNKGRLPISTTQVIDGSKELGIDILEIKLEHILEFNKIVAEHTDPFDLMLCAQAKSEDMTLVTADKTLLASFPDSIDAKL